MPQRMENPPQQTQNQPQPQQNEQQPQRSGLMNFLRRLTPRLQDNDDYNVDVEAQVCRPRNNPIPVSPPPPPAVQQSITTVHVSKCVFQINGECKL